MSDKERTEVSELGEFGLIDRLTGTFTNRHPSTIKGVGDDAAVLGEGKQKTVVTTDMLIEGVHFDLSFHPLKHLGYKAVAVNISDLCAMNAVPQHITVSLAFSNRFSLEALEELYAGIKVACERYKVDLVGGDTSSAKQGLMISVTAIGTADEDEIVYRKGASNKELLCVSGDLGGAYLGLQILEREKRIYLENPSMQPELSGYNYIVQRQLKPEARIEVTELFREKGFRPTSMIDISDGLASEVIHLCRHSGVGMSVYETKLPIDQNTFDTAEQLNLDPTSCALNGGEDYELLFTIKQEDFEKVKDVDFISVIGHCTDASEGINLITRNDRQFTLKALGWQHFRQ